MIGTPNTLVVKAECFPLAVEMKITRKETVGTGKYISSIPFINITRYKKKKLFSVNELSNNIRSADYT